MRKNKAEKFWFSVKELTTQYGSPFCVDFVNWVHNTSGNSEYGIGEDGEYLYAKPLLERFLELSDNDK